MGNNERMIQVYSGKNEKCIDFWSQPIITSMCYQKENTIVGRRHILREMPKLCKQAVYNRIVNQECM